MKIAIVTHRIVRGDGQGRVNYEIAKKATAEFDEVILISDEISPDLLHDPRVRWVRVSHGPLPTAFCRNLWFLVASSSATRRARADGALIVVNGAITACASDVNIVHFVHGSWLRSSYYEMRRGWPGVYQRCYGLFNARLERWAFTKTRAVVAISQRVASELVSIGVPRAKIDVIANGVDVEEFSPGWADRTALSLPAVGIVGLFVGDITTERKNLGTVLKAMVHVPGLSLAVVGDARKSRFPDEARLLGVEERVAFLGFRRDVRDLMRATDIFIFPSRYEPSGLVLLEAMSSGLAIIAAATAGAAELIEEGAGLKITDPNDVEALVSHLVRLMADGEERVALGRAARAIALEATWDKMGQRYVSLFRRLAESGGNEKSFE